MFVPQRSDYQSFYSFRNRTHRTPQFYSVTGAFLLKEDFSGSVCETDIDCPPVAE